MFPYPSFPRKREPRGGAASPLAKPSGIGTSTGVTCLKMGPACGSARLSWSGRIALRRLLKASMPRQTAAANSASDAILRVHMAPRPATGSFPAPVGRGAPGSSPRRNNPRTPVPGYGHCGWPCTRLKTLSEVSGNGRQASHTEPYEGIHQNRSEKGLPHRRGALPDRPMATATHWLPTALGALQTRETQPARLIRGVRIRRRTALAD